MAGFPPPIYTSQVDAKTKIDEKVDYSNLPCPVTYEELHREAYMSLKPELFEGFRFDYNKMLNQKFFLSHSVLMGPTEVPSQSSETIKIPTANYEFGATFIDPKLMLIARIMTDGRLTARAKCDLTDNFSMKANGQLTNEEHMSQGHFTFDYKGSDYRAQLQLGNGSLYAANYIQHVTPHLSLGGEVFWSGQHRKSGVGYAARYETDKMVASGQVASTGVAVMNYVHKVSEKVSLATDFIYNYLSRDVTASVGYDYIFRQCRLRGKIDSNGVAAAYLEEQLPVGLRFLLSAEVKVMNMIAACHVILLELWWNPTTENQAIDRAQRSGQTRPVTVTRITIKDTVEDRILAHQEDKRKMIASAFLVKIIVKTLQLD